MTHFRLDATRIFILALPSALVLACLDAGFAAAWIHAGWLDLLEVLPLFLRDLVWSGATLLVLLAASVGPAVVLRRAISHRFAIGDRRLAIVLGIGLAALFGAISIHHSLESLQVAHGVRAGVLVGFCVWVGVVTAMVWARTRDGRRSLASLAAPLLVAAVPFASGIRVDQAEAVEQVSTPAGNPSSLAPLVDSIVLITLDTTRLDAVGYSGSGRTRTPVLDRLAEEGAAFVNATTPIPLTLPSHTSMMTGLLPWQHGVVVNGARIPAEVQTLAEILERADWRTGGFVSAPVVEAETGIARGFQRFDDGVSRSRLPAKGMATTRILRRLRLFRYPSVRKSEEVTRAAVDWLDRRSREERTFVWLHLFDSHAPYETTGPFECEHRELLRALTPEQSARFEQRHGTPDWFADHLHEVYDREVEGMDRQVGRIVESLRENGRLGSSLVIVVADHGESFDEPERFDHAGTLTEDTLRIPLIVRLEGRVEPGSRPTALASVQDVHATVLEAAGISNPRADVSLSLISAGAEAVGGHGREFTRHETYPHPMASSRERLVAIRDGRSKLVLAPERNEIEFFHVDEAAEFDRSHDTDRSEELARMGRWLALDDVADRRIAKVDLLEDEETIEMLRSLGYVD